jgi:hypothetical protein
VTQDPACGGIAMMSRPRPLRTTLHTNADHTRAAGEEASKRDAVKNLQRHTVGASQFPKLAAASGKSRRYIRNRY